MCKGEGYLDYRELLNRNDIDAVIIATPDHWHAKIASEAMERGKDVYLEKPMTHTVEEARDVHETVVKSKRVLQVGSQTTSSDQWWKARKAIQDGMIGQLLMSQGSYHRTPREANGTIASILAQVPPPPATTTSIGRCGSATPLRAIGSRNGSS